MNGPPSTVAPPTNPFLPPDKHLLVDDAFTDTHCLVLNKFAVRLHHVLAITRGTSNELIVY
jgi:ATP adenylyltransferase/5',5'''-P-1,P-4-tetraphosphate phosphorylase II